MYMLLSTLDSVKHTDSKGFIAPRSWRDRVAASLARDGAAREDVDELLVALRQLAFSLKLKST